MAAFFRWSSWSAGSAVGIHLFHLSFAQNFFRGRVRRPQAERKSVARPLCPFSIPAFPAPAHGQTLAIFLRWTKRKAAGQPAACFYSLSLNLYPMPQMVWIYSGASGLGSIFLRSLRIKAMMLLSSSR